MKHFYLFASALFMTASAMCQFPVTLRVDMNGVATDSLHVAGNFMDNNYDNVVENAAYVNWTPSSASGLLTDSDGDGIHEIVMNLVAGRYEFKFINGNDWPYSEDVPAACQVEVSGNDNRQIMVSGPMTYEVCYASCALCDQNSIRLRVDMNYFDDDMDGIPAEPGDDINPDGVYAYNAADMSMIALQDWNADNVWETVYASASNSLEFVYVNGPNITSGFSMELVTGACANAAGNRVEALAPNVVAPLYCWNLCDACVAPSEIIFSVNMNGACQDLTPGVNLVGTVTDWGTGVPMSDADGDGIYTHTLFLAPGNYEYKFRIGSGGWEGNPNRQLTVVADTNVTLETACFGSLDPCGLVFPPSDITFQVSTGNATLAAGDIFWVMGNFTNPQWQDGAIQMTDADGDGTWTATVADVCQPLIYYKYRYGAVGGTTFVEDTANFSIIGGCGVDNGGFSDNRVLNRGANDTTVCFAFNTCESCLTVGLEEFFSASDINVFPNPATAEVNLIFNSMLGQSLQVSLMDYTGRTVRSFNWIVSAGNNRRTLNLEDIPSGAYVMRIANAEQSSSRILIVE
jgi:hypothetical protein